jgi:nucleotide-binding universal stress UspA family protein
MFEHLLVPLDGSRLAEAALPAAAFLSRTLGAWVTLFHVIERGAPQAIHGERHLSDPAEASAYLNEVAARAFSAGVHVEQHVHTTEVADVARSIVQHANELGPDLIVMCTHGQGGLRTWLLGSIAQKVIALGATPVVLIQPDGIGATPSFACRRLLVPLDGHADHEQGLVVAAALAQACAADLHLLMVIPTLGTLPGEHGTAARLLPTATSAWLDQSEEAARTHLHLKVVHLQASGVPTTVEVCRGDPAGAIARTALRVEADLIVMGTHGKRGIDAFWSGSVAAQVSSRSRVPLLLVPVRESGSDGLRDAQTQNQRLRDEIKRLKGEQGKPKLGLQQDTTQQLNGADRRSSAKSKLARSTT